MEKIKIVTDTPSDIPDADLERYNIGMLSIPLTVDGVGYYERTSFSVLEFYDMIEAASELPTTSRIPVTDYLACYQRNFAEGYTHLINVIINAGGSGTFASAQMARELFYQQTPQAAGKMEIHLVDSGTYSMAYGYPVIQAARMAQEGRPVRQVLSYLRDYLNRVEIYIACYTLEYARRSGRIGAAAAFVGDVLGLRPIILMSGGQTKVVDKVRGDKNIPSRLLNAYRASCADRSAPVVLVRGSLEEPARELQSLILKETGQSCTPYYAGASIVINTGIRMLALTCIGKPRNQPS